MADAPKLNSATDATAARYAPLSALAVVALAVGLLYVLLLLLLGIQAYTSGQPLLNVWLFLLPAAGVFLAFIARRQVRNSEGALTDKGLAGVAWWVCVIGGACYFAYLVANDLTVRADSERAVVQWAEKVGKMNPDDPGDKASWEAYEQTLEAGSPLVGNRDAAHTPLEAAKYAQFRFNPLALVWARNRADAKFEPNGLRNWELTLDGKLNCEAAGTLVCPEGEFGVMVPMQGTPGGKGKGRVWQVIPATQFRFLELETAARTKYGWLISDLEREAVDSAYLFFEMLRDLPPFGPSMAVDRFVAGHRSAEYTELVRKPEGLAFRLQLVGPSAILLGPTDPTEVPPAAGSSAFFTRTNGQPITDAAFPQPSGQTIDQGLSTLRKVWEQPNLSLIAPTYMSKHRSPDVAPRFPLIDTTDPARVVVRVPVDFQPRRPDYPARSFSTGYLVMACDDPTALKELATAREQAKAGRDKPTRDRPPAARPFPLRVVRFETDLAPLALPDAGPGGGMQPTGGG